MDRVTAQTRAALHLLEAAVKLFYSRKRTVIASGAWVVYQHEYCCIVLSDMNACGRAKDHFKRTFKPRGVASEGAWFGRGAITVFEDMTSTVARQQRAIERRNFETRVWALLLAAASVE